jgi:hypothetical protein
MTHNETAIANFIAANGRAPECNKIDDLIAVIDLIRAEFHKAGESTSGLGWYWTPAAKGAIIAYWKAKRLAKA